jgi:hypothetical protein
VKWVTNRLFWADLCWFAAMFGLCMGVGQALLAGSSVLPFGDETIHLRKIFALQGWLAEADSTVEKFRLMALSGDAYPNVQYCFSQLFLSGERSIEHARLAQVALSALHAGIGVTIGRTLWGRPAAAAYVAIACFSPLILAYGQRCFIDVALVSVVGIALLFGEASDGFRRPGHTFGFVLWSAASLLVKWTALVWLTVPGLFFCYRAIIASSTVSQVRVGYAFRLLGLFGVSVASIFVASRLNPSTDWRADNLNGLVHLVVMVFGLLVATWAAFGAKRSPIERCVASVTAIVMMAGPWYASHFHFLLDRLSHETLVASLEVGRSSSDVSDGIETLRMMVPAGELLLVFGFGVALWVRRASLFPVARVLGATAGGVLTVLFLPFNGRYFLPVVPLLAGAIVTPWGGLSHRKQWALSAAVIGMVVTLSSGATFVPARADPLRYTWATNRVSVEYPLLPFGVGRVPAPMTSTELADWLDELEGVCTGPVCRAKLNSPVLFLQERGLEVVAMTRGIDLRFVQPCVGRTLSLGALSSSLTVCD